MPKFDPFVTVTVSIKSLHVKNVHGIKSNFRLISINLQNSTELCLSYYTVKQLFLHPNKKQTASVMLYKPVTNKAYFAHDINKSLSAVVSNKESFITVT